jgi:hypothetical protein
LKPLYSKPILFLDPFLAIHSVYTNALKGIDYLVFSRITLIPVVETYSLKLFPERIFSSECIFESESKEGSM